jgi:nitrite reductase/ring-hydroxylating ferredoxin subunit
VQCLWHGLPFDARTGHAVCGPAETGVQHIALRVDNDQVLLRIPK